MKWNHQNNNMMMNSIHIAHFLVSIFKCTLQLIFKSCRSDQRSAYKGTAGSRYQFNSDLTQPTMPMNVGDNYMCKQRPPHQELCMYSLWIVGGFFNVTQACVCTKGLWDGAYAYRPYPRGQVSLTICRCNYKSSTFSSVILRPWVLVQPGYEPMTSCTLVRCSTEPTNT